MSQLHQQCLSTKCHGRYVHVSACICWYHVSICTNHDDVPVSADFTQAGMSVYTSQCALIETFFHYCPRQTKPWWPSTAQMRTNTRLCCTSRAPRPSLSCMLFPCLTSWASRLSFLQGITSPLPTACMTARRRATHWANAIGVASPAQTASCCSLKNKTKFQNKWSLIVRSVTRNAQCNPTTHI